MGWERKRGKLMDLNKLLRNEYDSFPVKIGDLSVLPSIRFVITLDADTELPRGSAHRMVGTLAHPLNQAHHRPQEEHRGRGLRNSAAARWRQRAERGPFPPRQHLSPVKPDSTSTPERSPMFTRISTAKAALPAKASTRWKTIHRVLDRRFPRNALLSHDLIEGAYARAGLVSDIEVIDDYPSHYSAYNRRKHRWLRGDWQIAGWLLPRVPDESGARGTQIRSRSFRNGRSSTTCVAAWSSRQPSSYWFWDGWFFPATAATGLWPPLPSWCPAGCPSTHVRFGASQPFSRATRGARMPSRDCSAANMLACCLILTFLPHQTLLSIDAVVRSLVRRFITGGRLLEWETAAKPNRAANSRSPVDSYLELDAADLASLWESWYSLRAARIRRDRPRAVVSALSKPFSVWLNRSVAAASLRSFRKRRAFPPPAALRTWRYFSEFCTASTTG